MTLFDYILNTDLPKHWVMKHEFHLSPTIPKISHNTQSPHIQLSPKNRSFINLFSIVVIPEFGSGHQVKTFCHNAKQSKRKILIHPPSQNPQILYTTVDFYPTSKQSNTLPSPTPPNSPAPDNHQTSHLPFSFPAHRAAHHHKRPPNPTAFARNEFQCAPAQFAPSAIRR